ncbi:hypothetical protein A1O7_07742 [Cladophialophora yegresii CBS 114405]|uniref:NodB homology domain-containing protein n=1 Tax=Cladophialophora yegresii CBS 114405 TaxID=1182544 RepID=W9VXH0_9EURO|nr:uncharacterized protein A1O7_07742 [Cladophialophora yegresii CBS 114405]EXJ57395.1 hypothetical protein A1O7_07742 [Cladophialophora yegresii CBS 114405]
MTKKVLVGYGIDVDAVSGWIDTKDGSSADPVDISRGIFGAVVGIDRLLKLWDRYKIKASWYVPAHSVESFPKQIAKIRDAGHEIGLHGYTHEYVSGLSEQQERDVLQKSIQVLTDFTGKKPRGWTAPAWTMSPRSIHLLEEMGIEYDHSSMHHDCLISRTPFSNYSVKTTGYKAQKQPASPSSDAPSAATWMTPMLAPQLSSVVTVPANWHLDDWPPFQPGDGGSDGFVDPNVLENIWKEHFLYFYEEYDEFVFPLSIHPQVSGKPHVLRMHQRMIEWINTFQGVEWCTFGEMVDQYKKGEIKGFDMEAALGMGTPRQ